MLVLNGMVRYLWMTGKYATLTVVCKNFNADAVRFMYRDIAGIELLLSDSAHLNEAQDVMPQIVDLRKKGYEFIGGGVHQPDSWSALNQGRENFAYALYSQVRSS